MQSSHKSRVLRSLWDAVVDNGWRLEVVLPIDGAADEEKEPDRDDRSD